MSRFPNRKQRREKREEAAVIANEALAKKGRKDVVVQVVGDKLVVTRVPIIDS